MNDLAKLFRCRPSLTQLYHCSVLTGPLRVLCLILLTPTRVTGLTTGLLSQSRRWHQPRPFHEVRVPPQHSHNLRAPTPGRTGLYASHSGTLMARAVSDEARLGASVAVIGAGSAGLAAARVLRDAGLRVTIFEKNQEIGGVWRHRPELATPTPMYRSLVTNIPKESMSFYGHPFPDAWQSFTTHDQVLQYLHNFADAYGLHPLIKLACTVISVRNVAQDDQQDEENPGPLGKWEVVYLEGDGTMATGTEPEELGSSSAMSSSAGKAKREVFEAVCVCNGHFDQGFMPAYEGFQEFRGTSMHSRAYDRPDVEAFVGKRVLCVGSRSSGTDIAREMSTVASVVHVSDRSAVETVRGGALDNIWWRPGFTRFEGANGVRFTDGALEEVDTVVWCTGFEYSFPFLDGTGLLNPPVAQRVHPLYQQLFHVRYPSLTFVGLQWSVVPFPLFEVQANLIAAVMTERSSLPSRVERERWLAEDEREALDERGVGPTSRKVHYMGPLQWPYTRRLLRLAGGPGTLLEHGSGESGPCVDGKDGVIGRDASATVAIPKGRVEGIERDGVGLKGDDATPRVPEDSASDGEGEAEDDKAMSEILKIMEVKRAIHVDASRSRPTFPGGSDDYRRRMYRVDEETGSFEVTMVDRKSNGEGPS